MARPKEVILSRVKYTVSASKAESMVWGMAEEMMASPAGGAAVDLAALNYLYPSCSGAMLIHPACSARANGRASSPGFHRG